MQVLLSHEQHGHSPKMQQIKLALQFYSSVETGIARYCIIWKECDVGTFLLVQNATVTTF